MNEIEAFFDNLAISWDKQECCPEDFKLSLLKEIGIKKGDSVLDVACGTGAITGLLHDLSCSKVIGIDLSSEMINIAKKKYAGSLWAGFIHKDLFDYEGDGLFDEIVIYNAYPHFLEPDKLASKCRYLLKEGGRVAILHSLSRKKLDEHHSGTAKPISRSLMEPEKEAGYFDGFKIVTAKEDDHSFVLILEK